MNLLAQVLGALAILGWIISIQQKDRKNVLICQVVANGIYAIQYYLLGAFTAAFMNFTSFIRSIVFYKNDKKQSLFSLILFSLTIIVLGIVSYSNTLSLIPIVITLAYTYSVWQDNLTITRYVFLIAAFIWIYYNIQVGAYISVFGNILEIISGIVALIRFKRS